MQSYRAGDYGSAAFYGGLSFADAALGVFSLGLATEVRAGTQGAASLRGVVQEGIGAFSPINPGPLASDIANTFRSATYEGRVLSENTTLYRVIGNGGNPSGAYWTQAQPSGPLQSVIDSALDQNWGNTATTIITRTFPPGTRIYEGAAAVQRGLVGGGNQIYIPGLRP